VPIPSSASLRAIGDYGDIAEQVGSNGRGLASALLALRPGDRVPSGQYRPEQSLAPGGGFGSPMAAFTYPQATGGTRNAL
jgi:hypothetical protein